MSGTVKFSGIRLLDGIEAALVSVAEDRRVDGALKGVHVDAERGYVVGADGVRLSATKLDQVEGAEAFTLAVCDALEALIKGLTAMVSKASQAHAHDEVTAVIEPDAVAFSLRPSLPIEVRIPRINVEYPDYAAILARDYGPEEARGYIKSESAAKQLRKLLPLARAASKENVPIGIHVHNASVDLIARCNDEMLVYTQDRDGSDGNAMAFVNGNYLLDFLEFAKGHKGTVVVSLHDKPNPVVFSMSWPFPEVQHLIMPLAIANWEIRG